MKGILKKLGGFVLTILGFGSMAAGCLPFACEYGTPHADFQAEISVADGQGKPLQGIRTILRYRYDYDSHIPADTLYSSNLGRVQLYTEVFSSPFVVDIIYDDLSGVFESDSTLGLTPVQIKEGDKKWYSGTFRVTDSKTLKKK